MAEPSGYRFGPFVLDLDRMALTRDGRQLELRPKAYDTLHALVQDAGRTVSKDDLVARVWPGVFVHDDALAQCVRDVRRALGPEGEALVRTVPKRGYIFTVEPVPLGADSPAETASRPLRNGRWWIVTGIVASVIMTAFAWAPWPERASSEPPFARDPRLTIAVLPFSTTGEGTGNEWLGEGMAEDVMTALSRFRDLAVVARNSSFRYASGEVDPATIRQALAADFMLEGSVRRLGQRLRVAVQLVDLKTGTNSWTERYDRSMSDLLDVRDDMIEQVATRLVNQARTAAAENVRDRPAERLDAYELVLRARKDYRTFSPDGAFAAFGTLGKALELDPDYAVARDLLASVLLQFYVQPYDERRGRRETLDAARLEAERAVTIDPSYSSGHATLGQVLAWSGEHEAGLAQVRRALELNPNDPTAIANYADVLSLAGEHAASIEAWEAVALRDPVGVPLRLALLARALAFADRDREALTSARECAARAPKLQPCLIFLTLAAMKAGNEAEAKKAAARLMEVNSRFTVSGHLSMLPYARREDSNLLRSLLTRAGVAD